MPIIQRILLLKSKTTVRLALTLITLRFLHEIVTKFFFTPIHLKMITIQSPSQYLLTIPPNIFFPIRKTHLIIHSLHQFHRRRSDCILPFLPIGQYRQFHFLPRHNQLLDRYRSKLNA